MKKKKNFTKIEIIFQTMFFLDLFLIFILFFKNSLVFPNKKIRGKRCLTGHV